jgi:alpha-beta hydrolase superfamily lysophospholipase
MVLLLVTAGSAGPAAAERFSVDAVLKALRPLDFSAAEGYSPPVQDYLRYYDIAADSVRHVFGTFRSGQRTLAGHVYNPQSTAGTLILLHGYYDHTGILRHLIRFGLQRGLCVAAFDLPGHGLSGGERSSIGAFGEYRQALEDFLAVSGPHLPRPWYLVGHSTGCAVGLEYLFTQERQPFRAVVFLAPLVRAVLWDVSKAGNFLLRRVVTRTPRWFRNASSDRALLEFFEHDPLQDHSFPMAWSDALYAWEREVQAYAPRPLPLTIIQGTRDGTVDWRYNLPLLQRKVPGCTTVLLKGARHQLPNEALPLRQACLDALDRALFPPTAER